MRGQPTQRLSGYPPPPLRVSCRLEDSGDRVMPVSSDGVAFTNHQITCYAKDRLGFKIKYAMFRILSDSYMRVMPSGNKRKGERYCCHLTVPPPPCLWCSKENSRQKIAVCHKSKLPISMTLSGNLNLSLMYLFLLISFFKSEIQLSEPKSFSRHPEFLFF